MQIVNRVPGLVLTVLRHSRFERAAGRFGGVVIRLRTADHDCGAEEECMQRPEPRAIRRDGEI